MHVHNSIRQEMRNCIKRYMLSLGARHRLQCQAVHKPRRLITKPIFFYLSWDVVTLIKSKRTVASFVPRLCYRIPETQTALCWQRTRSISTQFHSGKLRNPNLGCISPKPARSTLVWSQLMFLGEEDGKEDTSSSTPTLLVFTNIMYKEATSDHLPRDWCGTEKNSKIVSTWDGPICTSWCTFHRQLHSHLVISWSVCCSVNEKMIENDTLVFSQNMACRWFAAV